MVPMRFTIDQKQCKKINKSCLNAFRPSQESKRSFHYEGYTSRLQRLKQVRHLQSSQNKSSNSRCLPNIFIESQSSRIQRLKFITNLQCRLEKKPRPVSHPLIGNILTENLLCRIHSYFIFTSLKVTNEYLTQNEIEEIQMSNLSSNIKNKIFLNIGINIADMCDDLIRNDLFNDIFNITLFQKLRAFTNLKFVSY